MHQIQDFSIQPLGPISKAFLKKKIHCFQDALKWVHRLPYGRNSDRGDYTLIFEEVQGACSTKHAALAALCEENSIEAELQMVFCKLDTKLDPKAASFLKKLQVDFFPEAHTYLHYHGQDLDVTFADQSPYLKVEKIKMVVLKPSQIGEYKVQLHKNFVRNWMKDLHLDQKFTFEEIWALRENWIESLWEKKA